MPTHDTAWQAGTPCWVDYAATDLEAAKSFYRGVLDWDYTDGRPEFGGYLNALSQGRMAAGFLPTMDPAQPTGWTTYFATDDADATAAAITGAGGSVLAGPMPVADLGVMTVALDGQGTPFGTWAAGSHTGFGIYNEPGSVIWNEAHLAEPASAREFYSAVFGFTFDPLYDGADYCTFRREADVVGGLGGHADGAPHGWLVCFCVPSCDTAAAAVEAGGGQIHTAPHDTPFGRIAVVADPWGAPFELLESPRPASQEAE